MSKLIESVPATSIIRTDHNKEKPYAMINKAILRDKRLGMKEMGLLCYLLSLPSDWQVRISELPNHFSDGKDSVRATLSKLQNFGYATIKRVRDMKGRIISTEVLVYEECQRPIDNQGLRPYPDYPYMEKPYMENPPLLNTDLLNTDLTKEQQQGPPPSEQEIAKAKSAVAVFVKSERKKVANGEDIVCDVFDAGTDVLIQDLGRIDITNALAVTLIQRYGRERVGEVLLASQEKDNPAGYLRKALAENWKLSEKKSQQVAPKEAVRLHQRSVEEQKQQEQWATMASAAKELRDNPTLAEQKIEETRKAIRESLIASRRNNRSKY